MKTNKKVYPNIKTKEASSHNNNRCPDSRGRIFFCTYLYNRYTGNSDRSMIPNMAAAFIFNQNSFSHKNV
ncbi:MAG TPA: hypothetical protein VGO58_19040 [Chitinophagaceae bacterium]|nr:hypothetical protein [Chitinophagaceae bacterium]